MQRICHSGTALNISRCGCRGNRTRYRASHLAKSDFHPVRNCLLPPRLYYIIWQSNRGDLDTTRIILSMIYQLSFLTSLLTYASYVSAVIHHSIACQMLTKYPGLAECIMSTIMCWNNKFRLNMSLQRN